MLVLAATALRATAQSTLPNMAVRRFGFDPVALRAGQFVYGMTLERDAAATPLGTRTISASLATYAGTPAWLLLETRMSDSGATSFVDSLFTDPSLRPMHWSGTQWNARLGA